ncbi:MAG: hypothetical protein ACI841_003413, partial [Planctomycetota bacterium]
CVATPPTPTDFTREVIADAGGRSLASLLENPSRNEAMPIMTGGATKLMLQEIEAGRVHGVIGMGGTQGTSAGTAVMQALPYGFPKVMVSTVASGDTSAFVGIKDITMMFSVGDIIGLNPVTRKILSNAAGATYGMACSEVDLASTSGDKPMIGMTNLGVITDGALRAIEQFHAAGYEVIVFHAVGSGGRAMEQMMKDGLIGAVFDYGLGEIPDELYDGLRAGGDERLRVAGRLGIPQVICPGGLEHIGLFTEPNVVPEAWAGHQTTFHSPIIVAVRMNAEEMTRIAREITTRLASTKGKACFMMPKKGTSRYGIEGGELYDPIADEAFLTEIRASLPDTIELVERDLAAEDHEFVDEAVQRMIALIEG